MKTTLSVFFILVLSNIYGQEFAPDSAVWNYTYNFSFWNIGYIRLNVIGDTIIQGKNCKIIQRRNIGHNTYVNQDYNIIDGVEYVYSDTDKVYYYRFNQFHTLYDFSATPGDSWIIAGDDYWLNDSLAKVIVDSIGTITINSVVQRTLYLHTDSGSFSFIDDQIIERIGSVWYMFPIRINVTGPDWPGPFRCYYDDAIGLYHYSPDPCDVTYDNLPIFTNGEIVAKLYPNPVISTSTLEWDGMSGANYTLYIYNNLGIMIKTISTDTPSIILIKTDFSPGLYFYRLTLNQEQVNIGKFEIN